MLGILQAAKQQNTDIPEKQVTPEIMKAFNEYTDYLAQRGLSGNPQMNHIQFSNSVFDEYKKANPSTPLTQDWIKPIQQEIHKYRNFSIEEIKSGKSKVVGEIKPDYSNYMQWANTGSGVLDDGIVGQYTSMFKFPSRYMQQVDNNIKRIGFAAGTDSKTSIASTQK